MAESFPGDVTETTHRTSASSPLRSREEDGSTEEVGEFVDVQERFQTLRTGLLFFVHPSSLKALDTQGCRPGLLDTRDATAVEGPRGHADWAILLTYSPGRFAVHNVRRR